MSTYAKKAASFGAPSTYPVQSYGNEEYYRQQPQTYVQTSYPQGQIAYGGQTAQTYGGVTAYTQPQVYNYTSIPHQDTRDNRMASFNPGAPPPNFNRPPPVVGKSDDDFQAASGLSMFEAATAQSSAAYTASWVSSTSSIPPDLKDTPEGSTSAVLQIVGDFGQWNNPDVQRTDDGLSNGASAVYTPPATHSMQEQFGNTTIGEQHKTFDNNTSAWTGRAKTEPMSATQLANQHWPGLGAAPEKSAKDKKKEEKEKKNKEQARELTWEERLKKAQGAKERAENPRTTEREEKGEKPVIPRQEENALRGGRVGRGHGLGRGGKPSKGEHENENGSSTHQNREQRFNGQRRGQNNGLLEGDQQHHQLHYGQSDSRGMRGGRGMLRGGPVSHMPNGPPMVMFRGGAPMHPGMIPSPFMPPGSIPPMIPPQTQQDQKFKHSWLDANLFIPPFPMPFPPMVPPMMGIRGRVSRGFMRGGPASRGRGGLRRLNGREDENEKNSEEGSQALAEEIIATAVDEIIHIEELIHKEKTKDEDEVIPKDVITSKENSPAPKESSSPIAQQ